MKISLSGPNKKKEEATTMAYGNSNDNFTTLPHVTQVVASAPPEYKVSVVYPAAPSNEDLENANNNFAKLVKCIYYNGTTSNPAGIIVTKLRGIVFAEVGKYKKRAFPTQEIVEFDKIMFDVVFDLIDLFISTQRCISEPDDILNRSEMACMVIIKNGLQITGNWNDEDPNYMNATKEFLHEVYSVFFDPAN